MPNTRKLVAAMILAAMAGASPAADPATVIAAPIHTITPVPAPPDAAPAAGSEAKPAPGKARHAKPCRKAAPAPASPPGRSPSR